MWMWENIQWVGDDDWIVEAIDDGSLIAVTDGSYMKDIYPNIHSAVSSISPGMQQRPRKTMVLLP